MISSRVCLDIRGASVGIGGAGACLVDWEMETGGGDWACSEAGVELCPWTKIAGRKNGSNKGDAKRTRSIKHPRVHFDPL